MEGSDATRSKIDSKKHPLDLEKEKHHNGQNSFFGVARANPHDPTIEKSLG